MSNRLFRFLHHTLLLLMLFGIFLPVAQSALPLHRPVPGGIAVLPLEFLSEQTPLVKFGHRQLATIQHQNKWYALVGLPIDMLPGNYIVNTSDPESDRGSLQMQVNAFAPRVSSGGNNRPKASSVNASGQPLRLPASFNTIQLVNPAMGPLLITDDIKFGAYNSNFEFGAVVDSKHMVPYGKFIVDNRMIVHDYLSYLVPQNSQIYAPAAGVIMNITNDKENGSTVYLHHGGGIVSVIGHLRQVNLVKGQQLDRGEHLGIARSLSKFDGGRLDWGLSINGYLVDPLVSPVAPGTVEN